MIWEIFHELLSTKHNIRTQKDLSFICKIKRAWQPGIQILLNYLQSLYQMLREVTLAGEIVVWLFSPFNYSVF